MHSRALALFATGALTACAPVAPAPVASPVSAAPSPPLSAQPRAQALATALPSLPEGEAASYTLSLVREPFPFIEVSVLVHGSASGVTHFALHKWANVEHPEREIHGVRITEDAGAPLAVTHESVWSPKGSPATWTVHHAPGALLRVHYDLVSTQLDIGFDGESYYRPLLNQTFFHAIGHVTFLDPDSVADDVPLRFGFHWRGFREAGWKVASSFGVEQDDLETTQTKESFAHAVFLAGDLHLLRRDIGPSKQPLWLAIAPGDWGFTDDAFADLAAGIVGGQRAFFRDDDWPFFLISVIPVAGDAKSRSHTRGGTGLTHSFALFLSPHASAGSDAHGDGVPKLLAHELFHMWNGARYELNDPEPLGYWFSEGFTDFYARRLSYRAGLLDAKAFVSGMNETLRKYALSPVRTAPATRIVTDFWKNPDVEKLPYLRGEIVALLVDGEIRSVSKGAKGLDDLMKELLSVRKSPTPKVDSEVFLRLIASYTSPAFADRVRKIVIDGALATLDPKLLEPCLHAHTESRGNYEPGLDVGALESRHVIQGVVPGSNAYRAGLRDGQSLRAFERSDDHERPVKITIQEGARERVIQYLPQGKPVPVVQLSIDDPASPACAQTL